MRKIVSSIVQTIAHYKIAIGVLCMLGLIVGPLWAQTTLPFNRIPKWKQAAQPLSADMTPVGVMGGQAVIQGDKLYLIGGKRSDGKISGALVTSLGSNGPGDWHGAGSQPDPAYFHAVADNGKAVYVVGGVDDQGRYGKNVWCATKNSASDSLGDWIKISDYPTQTVLHSAAATEAYLYVLGGLNSQKQPVDVVQRAAIRNDCTPFASDQWQKVTVQLPKALARTAGVAYNKRIYITGGSDGVTAQSAIYYANENADGSLTGWQVAKSLPEQLYDHQLVISNDTLFILGGRDNTNASTKVYSIAIDQQTGELKGSWAEEPSLSTSLYNFAAVASPHGALYVIGGSHNDIEQNQVYYASMNTPTPTSTPTALPTATPIPTPTPGLTWLQLRNEPDTAIAPDDTLVYTIQYQNGGYPLENAVIMNIVPNQFEFVQDNTAADAPFKFQSMNPVSRKVVWVAETFLPTNTVGQVAYQVRRPLQLAASSGLSSMQTGHQSVTLDTYNGETTPLLPNTDDIIINAGATMIWTYQGQAGIAHSNSVFNPAQKIYLPVIRQ